MILKAWFAIGKPVFPGVTISSMRVSVLVFFGAACDGRGDRRRRGPHPGLIEQRKMRRLGSIKSRFHLRAFGTSLHSLVVNVVVIAQPLSLIQIRARPFGCLLNRQDVRIVLYPFL